MISTRLVCPFSLGRVFVGGLLVAFASLGSAQQPGTSKARPQKGEKPKWLVDLPEDFVQYARVPDGGRMPRLARRGDGLALLYFKGEAPGGDLYLARSADEAKSFTAGVQVNPESGTVAAWEGNHSGAVALGPDGRACLAWIESGEKSGENASESEPPRLRFRQETADGLGDVVDFGSPPGLCGNAAVAVDAEGRIFVAYPAGVQTSETARTSGVRVWLRRSLDGKTFGEPVAIDRDSDGFSPLSALAMHVDEVMGTVFLLYRAGFVLKQDDPSLSRCMRLLSSEDHGETFGSSIADNWKQQKDPHSSAHLSQDKNTTLAAWDTGGRVYWSLVRRQLNKVNLPVEAKDEQRASRRTQPSAAASESEVLLTWLERPRDDPSAAPTLGWQVWLIEGRLPQGLGHAPGPVLDGGIAFARRAGGFTIVY